MKQSVDSSIFDHSQLLQLLTFSIVVNRLELLVLLVLVNGT